MTIFTFSSLIDLTRPPSLHELYDPFSSIRCANSHCIIPYNRIAWALHDLQDNGMNDLCSNTLPTDRDACDADKRLIAYPGKKRSRCRSKGRENVNTRGIPFDQVLHVLAGRDKKRPDTPLFRSQGR
jgi:hypothetical protein